MGIAQGQWKPLDQKFLFGKLGILKTKALSESEMLAAVAFKPG